MSADPQETPAPSAAPGGVDKGKGDSEAASNQKLSLVDLRSGEERPLKHVHTFFGRDENKLAARCRATDDAEYIHIKDASVSGLHAFIQRRYDVDGPTASYFLQDLGSSNGTHLVSGGGSIEVGSKKHKTRVCKIAAGDVIKLSEIAFAVKETDSVDVSEDADSITSEGTKSGPITTTRTRESPLGLQLTVQSLYGFAKQENVIGTVGRFWMGRDPESVVRARPGANALRDRDFLPDFYVQIPDPSSKLSRVHCRLEVSYPGGKADKVAYRCYAVAEDKKSLATLSKDYVPRAGFPEDPKDLARLPWTIIKTRSVVYPGDYIRLGKNCLVKVSAAPVIPIELDGIQIRGASTTTLALKWDEPKETKDVRGYEVRIKLTGTPGDGDLRYGGVTPQCLIGGLEPGKSYTVRIQARMGPILGPPMEATYTTLVTGNADLSIPAFSNVLGLVDDKQMRGEGNRDWIKGIQVSERTRSKVFVALASTTVMIAKTYELDSDPNEEQIRARVESLCELRHPNLVNYYGVNSNGDANELEVTTFMEYVPDGSVSMLKAGTRVQEQATAVCARHVLSALCALHSAGFVHGNIKPANILINRSSGAAVYKLADAASQFIYCGMKLSRHENKYYRAPEVSNPKGEYLEPPSDMWSLGVSLFEMVSGDRPDIAEGGVVSLRSLEGQVSPNCIEFLSLCFDPNPNARLTAEDALQHPWIACEVAAYSYNNVTKWADNFSKAIGEPESGLYQITLPDGLIAAVRNFGVIDRMGFEMSPSETAAATAYKRELSVAGLLQSSGVAALVGKIGQMTREPQLQALIYELPERGDLASFLAANPGAEFPADHRLRVAADIASGMSELHDNFSAVHGDIQSTKVRLRDNGEAVLFDLGTARIVGRARNSAAVYAQDVYGFGIILLELLSGQPHDTASATAFSTSTYAEQQAVVDWGVWNERDGGIVVEIARGCLAAHVGDRLEAREIVSLLSALATDEVDAELDAPDGTPSEGLIRVPWLFVKETVSRPRLAGEGAYSVVYKAKLFGSTCAIKVFRQGGGPEVRELFVRELCAYDRVRSAAGDRGSLMELPHGYAVGPDESCCAIVLSYADGGNLRNALSAYAVEPSAGLVDLRTGVRRVAIALDVAACIAEVHCLGAAEGAESYHGNVKGDSVLLFKNDGWTHYLSWCAKIGCVFRPSLCGFGGSVYIKMGERGRDDITITHGYLSPESYVDEQIQATDVYCFGVILLELLTGYPPQLNRDQSLADAVIATDKAKRVEEWKAVDVSWGDCDLEALFELAFDCIHVVSERATIVEVVERLSRLLDLATCTLDSGSATGCSCYSSGEE